jgi:hypothetical protein
VAGPVTHFIEICEFGATHKQCRCPDKNKPVRKVTCTVPDQHAAPGETLETLSFERPASVDNPSHYRASSSGVECIEIVRGLSFDMGNAIKYLYRGERKGFYEDDLRKAIWYLVDDRVNVEQNGWRSPSNLTLWSARFEQHITSLPTGRVRLALEAIRQSFLRHGTPHHLDIALALLRDEAKERGIPASELRAS